MCYITATEFKKRLGYYMELSNKEDVYVTKNNKVITVLVSPEDKALQNFLALEGILYSPEVEKKTNDEILGEEILKRCGF